MDDSHPRPEWITPAPEGDRFKGRRRVRPISGIVLHESVTRTAATAIRVLQRRRLSVHYTIDRDGSVVEHCPPERRCAHAGAGKNGTTIGLECISRYYGAHAREGDDVIAARWAHRGSYILPPADGAQLRSVWRLVRWLVMAYDVPCSFPGLDEAGRFRWGRIPNYADPGIMAHHRFGHADGLAYEAYAVLRFGGLGHERAQEWMTRLAASGQRVTDLPIGMYCAEWPDEASAIETEASA